MGGEEEARLILFSMFPRCCGASQSNISRENSDEYNNSNHSMIRQKPIDVLRVCWSTRSDVTIAEKIVCYGRIKHLKCLIANRGEQGRQHYMKKRQNVQDFHEGDVVFVRVSKKYRTKDQYLFGRELFIVSRRVILGNRPIATRSSGWRRVELFQVKLLVLFRPTSLMGEI